MQDDRCNMVIFKTIQYIRLQATSKNAKKRKRTNLKDLPRAHKLPQSAPTESVKGGVKIGKICLPLVGPLCLSKDLKKGQPPQKHRFPTIGKEVSSQQMRKEDPSHLDALLHNPLWKKHVVQHQVEAIDGLSGLLPP